jgi:hypothetical protein
MLDKGDHIPHFTVTTLDGLPVTYADIWQRRNLVLVCWPPRQADDRSTRYVAALQALVTARRGLDAVVVATSSEIPGAPCPGMVIADRWGEVQYVAASRIDDLPDPADVADWLDYIRIQCPECEGEAR